VSEREQRETGSEKDTYTHKVAEIDRERGRKDIERGL
jgi:hypothetical protein